MIGEFEKVDAHGHQSGAQREQKELADQFFFLHGSVLLPGMVVSGHIVAELSAKNKQDIRKKGWKQAADSVTISLFKMGNVFSRRE